MLTRNCAEFLEFARQCQPDFGPATAKAAFLVSPDGFARAAQSAADNRYMADDTLFDAVSALSQHHELQRALSTELPVFCFAGDAETPDAVFPNNVFATAPGQLIVGRMRHPVRQLEAQRTDIRGFFTEVLAYRQTDLSTQLHPCELTGSLVIDRARGLGFCGLSERCDEQGAALMHEAFGLRATLAFDLAPGEYHTNVVLAVLAGRAVLLSPSGFADENVCRTLEALYSPHAIRLSLAEHMAFAANAIALSGRSVWMSAAAEQALAVETRARLEAAGFTVRSVALDAVEAAGGSLRCCVAEVY